MAVEDEDLAGLVGLTIAVEDENLTGSKRNFFILEGVVELEGSESEILTGSERNFFILEGVVELEGSDSEIVGWVMLVGWGLGEV